MAGCPYLLSVSVGKAERLDCSAALVKYSPGLLRRRIGFLRSPARRGNSPHIWCVCTNIDRILCERYKGLWLRKFFIFYPSKIIYNQIKEKDTGKRIFWHLSLQCAFIKAGRQKEKHRQRDFRVSDGISRTRRNVFLAICRHCGRAPAAGRPGTSTAWSALRSGACCGMPGRDT